MTLSTTDRLIEKIEHEIINKSDNGSRHYAYNGFKLIKALVAYYQTEIEGDPDGFDLSRVTNALSLKRCIELAKATNYLAIKQYVLNLPGMALNLEPSAIATEQHNYRMMTIGSAVNAMSGLSVNQYLQKECGDK